MNENLRTGGLLTAAGLVSGVRDAWARHFFFAAFHVAKAESLEASRSVSPGPYGTSPASTSIFIGLRLLVWVVILVGLGLLT